MCQGFVRRQQRRPGPAEGSRLWLQALEDGPAAGGPQHGTAGRRGAAGVPEGPALKPETREPFPAQEPWRGSDSLIGRFQTS